MTEMELTETEPVKPKYGLKKFVHEYNSSFMSVEELRAHAYRAIKKHKLTLEKRKQESKQKKRIVDDDGWTTVTKSDKSTFRPRKALPAENTIYNNEPMPANKKRAPVKFL